MAAGKFRLWAPAVAAGSAVVAFGLLRSRLRARTGGGPKREPVISITILRRPDEVDAAWRDNTHAQTDVEIIPAPGDRGTEVRAAREWRESLRAFKQVMEAGEVATNDGQPVGNCVGRWLRW